MSVASEITRLQNAKASLKTAIEGKGVTVPAIAKIDAYPALVEIISGGSIEDLITKENLVRICINIGGTEFTLDAINNFSDLTGTFVSTGTLRVYYVRFHFNDLEISTRPIGYPEFPEDRQPYEFLVVGSKIFKIKKDSNDFYIYLNDVQIGHVYCTD